MLQERASSVHRLRSAGEYSRQARKSRREVGGVSGERRRQTRTMEEARALEEGFDPGRNALKYRCPAAAHGFACEGRAACERMGGGQAGRYGRVVRIGLDRHDRRIFTPTPYGSPSWKRGYRRRAALERINARPDRSFEFEQHFIRGLPRMRARVGLALSVMMALALGHVRAGCPERMRSLYGPVPPAFAGAGSGPTPADRLVPPQILPVRSRGPEPAPAKAGGLARARRPRRRILPFQGRLMRGFPALVEVDRAPSRRLQRPRPPGGAARRRERPTAHMPRCLRELALEALLTYPWPMFTVERFVGAGKAWHPSRFGSDRNGQMTKSPPPPPPPPPPAADVARGWVSIRETRSVDPYISKDQGATSGDTRPPAPSLRRANA